MDQSLVKSIVRIETHIDNLFLDPNNPRFISPEWNYISDDNIMNSSVQENIKGRLITGFGIEKLASNIRINGFLKIDRVVVKKINNTEDKYVVLEGNRRICAAKLIFEQAQTNSELPEDVVDSVTNIECLEYIGTDPKASWIFQGLRHISGITDWPPFNKAKLLVEQMETDDLTLTQVGERFGITAYAAGQWMRGYRAFQQASQDSDFIHELDIKSYPFFQEIFGRSSSGVREWLDWDDNNRVFKNVLNLDEFISWLYPREEEDGDAFGSWDKRHLKVRDDLRTLSYLIKESPDHFEEFRRTKNLENAYANALSAKQKEQISDQTENTLKILNTCIAAIDNLPAKALRNDEIKSKIIAICKKLIQSISDILPEVIENEQD